MISIAYAAEEAAQHAQASGLPQFNVATFSSQIFWTIISFLLLLFLLTRFVIPAINTILDARGKSIEDDLRQAKNAREEAEKILATHRKEMSVARQEAAKILEQARQESARQREQNKLDLENELARKKSVAMEEIEQVKRRAMEEIKDVVVELTIAATQKLVAKAITKGDANKMVEQVLTQMKEADQSPPVH